MKKILAFGASNSKNSINKKLAAHAVSQLGGVKVTLLDLNDFEMPIYGIDKEKEKGIPEKAQTFKELIRDHDAIIISFAEHNGAYSTAFKNVLDWTSRLEGKIWEDKPMFLLSTSPGKRGGATVMGIVLRQFPYMGGNIVANFSLPSFNQNFSNEKGIMDKELADVFQEQLHKFQAMLDG